MPQASFAFAPTALGRLLLASLTTATWSLEHGAAGDSADAGGTDCGESYCLARDNGYPTAGRRLTEVTFYIGAAWSNTTTDGLFWAGPPDPLSVSRSLDLLIATVNAENFMTQNGEIIRLQFLESPYGWDDRSNETVVRDIYTWYNTSAVDLLLCPSRIEHQQAAAESLAGSNKVLFCWSTETARYYDPPAGQHVPASMVIQTVQLMHENISKASYLTGVQPDYDFDQLNYSRARATARERDSMVSQSMESWRILYPDGPMWEVNSTTNMFDINVPFSLRWSNALWRASQYGADWLYIFETETSSAVSNSITVSAASMGYRNVTRARVYPDTLLQNLNTYFHDLRVFAPDVVVVLLSLQDAWSLLGAMRLFEIAPKFIMMSFYNTSVAVSMEGFVINQLHYPMSWHPPVDANRSDDLFGDFGAFNANYMSNYYSRDEFEYLLPVLNVNEPEAWKEFYTMSHAHMAPMTVLQICSVGTAYVTALRNALSSDPDDVAEALRNSQGVNTLLGTVRFDSDGKRSNHAPPFDGTATGTFTSWAATSTDAETRAAAASYVDARAATVSDLDPYDVPYELGRFVARFIYPRTEWKQLQYELYPCKAGCTFNGSSCEACKPGEKRSFQDLFCVPCEAGTYTSMAGSLACLTCLEDADCSDGIQPAAKKGWYRLNDIIEVSPTPAPTTPLVESCTQPRVTEPMYLFYKCPHGEVCLGRNQCQSPNTEIMCAQCETGNSFEFVLPGQRYCRACLEGAQKYCVILLVAFVWAILLYAFEMTAKRASVNPASGSCALLRTMIHYVQFFVLVCEGMHLDEYPSIAIVLSPFDIFYRPLSLIMLDCNEWLAPTLSDGADQDEIQSRAMTFVTHKALAHVAVYMVAICYFVFYHTLAIILETWKNTIRAVLTALAMRIKHRRKHMAFAAKFVGIKHKGPAEKGPGAADIAAVAAFNAVDFVRQSGEAIKELDQTTIERTLVGAVRTAQEGVLEGEKVMDQIVGIAIETTKDAADTAVEFAKDGGASGARRAAKAFKNKAKSKLLRRAVNTHSWAAWWMETSKRFSDFMRLVLAWTLMWQAPMLRGIAEVFRCREYEKNRFAYDLRVDCTDNDTFYEQQRFWVILYVLVAFGFWFFYAYHLWNSRMEPQNPLVRRMTCVLYDGYKNYCFYWEVFNFTKFALVTFIMHITPNQVMKAFLTLVTIVTMCMMLLTATPFEHRDREICKNMEMASLLGASFAITGQLTLLSSSQYDMLAPEFVKIWKMLVHVVVGVWFLVCLLYGLAALLFTELVLQIQVARECGCELGVNTSRFLKLGKLTWGLNEITLSRSHKRGAEHLLVHTQKLTVSERKHLDMTLRSLLEVCTSTGHKFYPSLLVVALNEGFERAVQARSARMRARYVQNGTGTQSVLKFWPEWVFSFGTLFQPLPDIQTGVVEEGVTVEELGYACESVGRDIMEYNPVLREKLVDAAKGDHAAQQENFPKTWEAATSVQGLLQDMLYSGALNEQGGPLQGERLRNLCRDYQHVFEQMTTVTRGPGATRWICMSSELKKLQKSKAYRFDTCKDQPLDGGSRVNLGSESAAANYTSSKEPARFKCLVCGLELCELCKNVVTEMRPKHGTFFKMTQEDPTNDEMDRIMALKRHELMDLIEKTRKEAEWLEKVLEEPGIIDAQILNDGLLES